MVIIQPPGEGGSTKKASKVTAKPSVNPSQGTALPSSQAAEDKYVTSPIRYVSEQIEGRTSKIKDIELKLLGIRDPKDKERVKLIVELAQLALDRLAWHLLGAELKGEVIKNDQYVFPEETIKHLEGMVKTQEQMLEAKQQESPNEAKISELANQLDLQRIFLYHTKVDSDSIVMAKIRLQGIKTQIKAAALSRQLEQLEKGTKPSK